ncbi:hypothetical protein GL218_01656 [Daldinia childiae]|uniref:uncharacterized protein n=1 Tax=Daldinia childiae TaxID=326645 RepID=UPI001446EC42|nr:uncharacterized protein GL218_01656 [Daldinia childiae]KAF3064704.1 hypothetical protein GL218_01656 [Daldinia childiae]
MAETKSGSSPDIDSDGWVEVENPSIPDDYIHVSKSDLESWSLPPVKDEEEDEDNADVVLQLTPSQTDDLDRLVAPKVKQLEKELRKQKDCNYSAAMEELFGTDAKDYQLMFNAAIPELRFQPRHTRDTYSPRQGVLYTALTTADKCKDAADLLLRGMRTRSVHGHNNTESGSGANKKELPGSGDAPSFTHDPDDVD